MEVMTRVATGDEDAFDLIYLRYQERLRAFFQTFGCEYHEAQDCAQQTLLRLWLARADYQPSGCFAAYPRNCWISRLRRLKSKPQEVPAEGDDSAAVTCDRLAQLSPMDRSPEESLMHEYRRWRIRRAVRSVPEPYRTALVLVHLHGMRYAEVAEELGIPIGTVKSRISAALGILRERLKEELL